MFFVSCKTWQISCCFYRNKTILMGFSISNQTPVVKGKTLKKTRTSPKSIGYRLDFILYNRDDPRDEILT